MGVYVGMDVHRKRSQVAILDAAGVQQRNRNLANDPAKLVPILGALAPGTPVAFEAAYGWGWLVELLEELELAPHLVHPSRCKAIASARLKNDKVDAATLAQLLRVDLLPEAWIAPQATRDLRDLLRHRAALVRLSTCLKNRVHAVWLIVGSVRTGACGPVRGGPGWPNSSCRRSHRRSWRIAVGCWTPWPSRSPGWSGRSPGWPSPTHGSRPHVPARHWPAHGDDAGGRDR
jgi:hypothetical protein